MRLPRCGRAAFRTALFSGIALFLAGLACNAWVILAGRPRLCHSLGSLAPHPVGLVLGTAPILGSGRPNPFFEGRMDAAAALYHAGKVRHWLLSGDNGRRSYDEPAAMRAALLARGDNEVGPYQSPMEDGMQHFHAWYRQRVGV